MKHTIKASEKYCHTRFTEKQVLNHIYRKASSYSVPKDNNYQKELCHKFEQHIRTVVLKEKNYHVKVQGDRDNRISREKHQAARVV